ncbi:MAG: hypothetical protein GY827_02095 [Cytophagales bacterium]|nr:hypothetical protein [Cytophagales bacterium]
MIKPTKPLFLLLYVLGFLVLFSLLFPPTNEIHLFRPEHSADSLDEGFTIKFFSFKDIFVKDTTADATDITSTVALAEELLKINKEKARIDSIQIAKQDSIRLSDSLALIPKDTIPNLDVAKIEKLLSDKYRIQFPDSHTNALSPFFSALNHIKHDSSLIRIIHYGDSQIEGDRITSQLRKNFQTQFGGYGVGLVPVFDPVQKSTIMRKRSSNWKNYLIYSGKYRKKNINNYGITGAYFGYTPIKKFIKDTVAIVLQDTIPQNDSLRLAKLKAKPANAWFEYKKGWKRDKQMSEVKEVTLLYGNVYEESFFRIKTPKDTLAEFIAPKDKGYHKYKFRFNEKFEKIRVEITAKKSPQVYGMALDGLQGVAVDNIGFRGSSGTEFTRNNMQLMAKQIKDMNVKLLIVQFGVNVAAGKQLKSYDFYKKVLNKQLKALKKLNPELSILVVSISDMAYMEKGKRVSRPSIEKVRNAQREAAFENGCAFWDLYEAMGGRNSMISWVQAKPSLAQDDYTHFNANGAELVGEMLYNALILAYAKHNKLVK